jgi:hypothetical protein
MHSDFKPLAPHLCGFESLKAKGTLDSFMLGSYTASSRNVGGSTQVPVHAWNNAGKGTWGLPPTVKLERRNLTYNVSVWRKTQLNKQTNKESNICKYSINLCRATPFGRQRCLVVAERFCSTEVNFIVKFNTFCEKLILL